MNGDGPTECQWSQDQLFSSDLIISHTSGVSSQRLTSVGTTRILAMDTTERDSFVRWCEDRTLAAGVIVRLLDVIPDDDSSDPRFTNWIDGPGYIMSVNDPDQGLGFDVELRDAGFLIIVHARTVIPFCWCTERMAFQYIT